MPLILCPTCGKVTYAFPRYDDEGEITSYRCSECYNVFNYDQVNILPFPNDTIILNDTFDNIVSEINKKEPDNPAEEFYYVLLYLCRPYEPRIYKHKVAYWDYRGTRDAEEYNDRLLEKLQEYFADAVDKYYCIVEITEPDEGDSIFIAIHPDDVEIIEKALKQYTLTRNKYNDAITPS
ncbi:MAG: hypothetical protein NDF55_10640 [archaeon GB-1867-005]|nr:hypothetical protein [Candidatus Culexmicrobium cathedralense]